MKCAPNILIVVLSALLLGTIAPSVLGKSATGSGSLSIYPAQSKVAAHTTFPAISSSSLSVRQSLPAMNPPAKAVAKGRLVTIQGTVFKVIFNSDNDIVTISFGPNFRSQIAARVLPANYSKLPNLKSLAGKHVLVSGKISYFAGRWPQILVTGPSQIQIIQ